MLFYIKLYYCAKHEWATLCHVIYHNRGPATTEIQGHFTNTVIQPPNECYNQRGGTFDPKLVVSFHQTRKKFRKFIVTSQTWNNIRGNIFGKRLATSEKASMHLQAFRNLTCCLRKSHNIWYRPRKNLPRDFIKEFLNTQLSHNQETCWVDCRNDLQISVLVEWFPIWQWYIKCHNTKGIGHRVYARLLQPLKTSKHMNITRTQWCHRQLVLL